tara:strand:+ start:79 stop:468 length:390 start_codon:yes stop_codon:yes gene_type:complete
MRFKGAGQNLQIDHGANLAGQCVTIANSKARRILQVKRWVTKSRTPRNAGSDGNALLAISRPHVRDFKRVTCSRISLQCRPRHIEINFIYLHPAASGSKYLPDREALDCFEIGNIVFQPFQRLVNASMD